MEWFIFPEPNVSLKEHPPNKIQPDTGTRRQGSNQAYPAYPDWGASCYRTHGNPHFVGKIGCTSNSFTFDLRCRGHHLQNPVSYWTFQSFQTKQIRSGVFSVIPCVAVQNVRISFLTTRPMTNQIWCPKADFCTKNWSSFRGTFSTSREQVSYNAPVVLCFGKNLFDSPQAWIFMAYFNDSPKPKLSLTFW